MARTPRAISNLSKNLKLSTGGIVVPSSYRSRVTGSVNQQFAGFDYDAERAIALPISIVPARPLQGTMECAIAIQEMKQWSIEANTAIAAVASDIFMSSDGSLRSWQAAGIRADPYSKDRLPLNPDSQAVILDLQQRRVDGEFVCGGTRMQRAAVEMMSCGDSFMKMQFIKDGDRRSHTGYCIGSTRYLPAMRTSIMVDPESDRCVGYREHRDYAEEDRYYKPIEILHFKHEAQSHYGTSVLAAMMPHWEALKKMLPALVSGLLSVGTSPWVHTMPEGCSPEKREKYIAENEALRVRKVLKHLYLDAGFDFKRSRNDTTGLSELLEGWLELRRSMIPMGLPDYYFSLPHRSSSANVSQQPAMGVSRLMSGKRGAIGEQIKWMCDIEIALKLGYEHLQANPYEIVWPHWQVAPVQEVNVHGDDEEGPATEERATTTRSLDGEFKDRLLIDAVKASLQND